MGLLRAKLLTSGSEGSGFRDQAILRSPKTPELKQPDPDLEKTWI